MDAQIARQVEFYFSDANLRRDKFMQQKLKEHADGFVPIAVLLTFNRLKALTAAADVVAGAIASKSTLLKLNDDQSAIARVTPFVETATAADQVKACTAYLNRIPADATIESLKEYLSHFGEVSLVRIPKNKDESDRSHRGFAFVEFTSPEAVAKLVAAIPRKPSQASESASDAAETESAPVTAEADEGETGPVPSEAASVKSDPVKAEQPAADGESNSADAENRPKPMYALTWAAWKEWTQTRRKAKKDGLAGVAASAGAEQPASKDASQHEIGRMVRVSGNLEGASKQDLMAIFSDLGAVRYVDFYGDAKFATVRFATAEIANEVVAKVAEGGVKFGDNVLEARVLTAEEQEQYWAQVHAASTRATMAKQQQQGRRSKPKKDKKRTRGDSAKATEAGSPKKPKVDGDADAVAA